MNPVKKHSNPHRNGLRFFELAHAAPTPANTSPINIKMTLESPVTANPPKDRIHQSSRCGRAHPVDRPFAMAYAKITSFERGKIGVLF